MNLYKYILNSILNSLRERTVKFFKNSSKLSVDHIHDGTLKNKLLGKWFIPKVTNFKSNLSKMKFKNIVINTTSRNKAILHIHIYICVSRISGPQKTIW